MLNLTADTYTNPETVNKYKSRIDMNTNIII